MDDPSIFDDIRRASRRVCLADADSDETDSVVTDGEIPSSEFACDGILGEPVRYHFDGTMDFESGEGSLGSGSDGADSGTGNDDLTSSSNSQTDSDGSLDHNYAMAPEIPSAGRGFRLLDSYLPLQASAFEPVLDHSPDIEASLNPFWQSGNSTPPTTAHYEPMDMERMPSPLPASAMEEIEEDLARMQRNYGSIASLLPAPSMPSFSPSSSLFVEDSIPSPLGSPPSTPPSLRFEDFSSSGNVLSRGIRRIRSPVPMRREEAHSSPELVSLRYYGTSPRDISPEPPENPVSSFAWRGTDRPERYPVLGLQHDYTSRTRRGTPFQRTREASPEVTRPLSPELAFRIPPRARTLLTEAGDRIPSPEIAERRRPLLPEPDVRFPPRTVNATSGLARSLLAAGRQFATRTGSTMPPQFAPRPGRTIAPSPSSAFQRRRRVVEYLSSPSVSRSPSPPSGLPDRDDFRSAYRASRFLTSSPPVVPGSGGPRPPSGASPASPEASYISRLRRYHRPSDTSPVSRRLLSADSRIRDALDPVVVKTEPATLNNSTRKKITPKILETMEKVGIETNQARSSRALTPDSCSICLEVPRPPAASLTYPCLHIYCNDCISKWVETKNSCPNCQAEVTRILYNLRGENDYDIKGVESRNNLLTSGPFGGEFFEFFLQLHRHRQRDVHVARPHDRFPPVPSPPVPPRPTTRGNPVSRPLVPVQEPYQVGHIFNRSFHDIPDAPSQEILFPDVFEISRVSFRRLVYARNLQGAPNNPTVELVRALEIPTEIQFSTFARSGWLDLLQPWLRREVLAVVIPEASNTSREHIMQSILGVFRQEGVARFQSFQAAVRQFFRAECDKTFWREMVQFIESRFSMGVWDRTMTYYDAEANRVGTVEAFPSAESDDEIQFIGTVNNNTYRPVAAPRLPPTLITLGSDTESDDDQASVARTIDSTLATRGTVDSDSEMVGAIADSVMGVGESGTSRSRWNLPQRPVSRGVSEGSTDSNGHSSGARDRPVAASEVAARSDMDIMRVQCALSSARRRASSLRSRYSDLRRESRVQSHRRPAMPRHVSRADPRQGRRTSPSRASALRRVSFSFRSRHRRSSRRSADRSPVAARRDESGRRSSRSPSRSEWESERDNRTRRRSLRSGASYRSDRSSSECAATDCVSKRRRGFFVDKGNASATKSRCGFRGWICGGTFFCDQTFSEVFAEGSSMLNKDSRFVLLSQPNSNCLATSCKTPCLSWAGSAGMVGGNSSTFGRNAEDVSVWFCWIPESCDSVCKCITWTAFQNRRAIT